MPPTPDSAGERSKTHGALANPSRVHILELLRRSSSPLDVQQIAVQRGLHPNTVRFHLKILVDAGLACCRPEPRGGSGRPRFVFTATTDDLGSRHPAGFQLLAHILASYLAASSNVAAAEAEEAGRAFARHHRWPEPFAAVSLDEAVRGVVAMFAELGFEPELARDTSSHLQILLHACPFRPIASEHPGVVCALHLGLLKQTLINLQAPVTAIRLEPFVTPHLCIAHLASHDAATS